MPDVARNEIDGELSERMRTVVGQLSRRLRRTRAGAQLTSTETTVLARTTRSGPVGLSELADQEGMNPTMLSRVVRRLEDAGLITRRADPDDRRAAFVEPTAAGRRLQQRIRSERNDAINLFVAGLAPEERHSLKDALPILERLAEHLKVKRS